MAREPSTAILDPLRRLVTRQHGSALSDAALLDNFVTRQDEPSFEVLVWRHGAMVLALCQRILRDAHEAEDAFQATFLVFARKAGAIGRGEVVAAWLYKVAYRVALRLRTASAKRTATGAPPADLPAPELAADTDWHDLRPVLDDEIARLPDKYRAPFVLCYLEGRTNEEAAAQLGCPKGTVLSRLSRGRERLRERLTRRGVALSATALALTLSQNAALASVPAAIVYPTVGAATAFATGKTAAELVPAHVAVLTDGVLKTMTLVKVKIAAAVLALAVLGTGITWAASGTGDAPAKPVPLAAAAPSPAAESNAGPAEEQPPARERPMAPALSGKVVSVAKDGKSFTVETPPTERGGEPGRTAVKLTEKATVTYHGVGANAALPVEGYQVQVWFEKDSKEIAATVAFIGPETARRAPDVTGTVTAVAKDGKSVTVELRPSQRPERGAPPKQETVTLDEKTVLAFSNVGKDEAKITVGHSAMVWYAEDVRVAGNRIAGKVQFTGTAEERARDEKAPDFTGPVMRAAPDGKSIVVEVPPAVRGEEARRLIFKLDEKSTTVFHNVAVDGAKVAPGLQAQVWLAEGSKIDTAKVRFTGTVPDRWKTLSGKVVSVAKDGSSVTLETPPTMRGEEPKRTEVKLTAKTKLTFFGVGPGEAKVAEGLLAQVRLLDGSPDTAVSVEFGKPGERKR